MEVVSSSEGNHAEQITSQVNVPSNKNGIREVSSFTASSVETVIPHPHPSVLLERQSYLDRWNPLHNELMEENTIVSSCSSQTEANFGMLDHVCTKLDFCSNCEQHSVISNAVISKPLDNDSTENIKAQFRCKRRNKEILLCEAGSLTANKANRSKSNSFCNFPPRSTTAIPSSNENRSFQICEIDVNNGGLRNSLTPRLKILSEELMRKLSLAQSKKSHQKLEELKKRTAKSSESFYIEKKQQKGNCDKIRTAAQFEPTEIFHSRLLSSGIPATTHNPVLTQNVSEPSITSLISSGSIDNCSTTDADDTSSTFWEAASYEPMSACVLTRQTTPQLTTHPIKQADMKSACFSPQSTTDSLEKFLAAKSNKIDRSFLVPKESQEGKMLTSTLITTFFPSLRYRLKCRRQSWPTVDGFNENAFVANCNVNRSEPIISFNSSCEISRRCDEPSFLPPRMSRTSTNFINGSFKVEDSVCRGAPSVERASESPEGSECYHNATNVNACDCTAITEGLVHSRESFNGAPCLGVSFTHNSSKKFINCCQSGDNPQPTDPSFTHSNSVSNTPNRSREESDENQCHSTSSSESPPSPFNSQTPTRYSAIQPRLSLIRCELFWPGTRAKSPVAPVANCSLQPIVVIKDHRANRVVDLSDANCTNTGPLTDESTNVATKVLSLSGVASDTGSRFGLRRSLFMKESATESKPGVMRKGRSGESQHSGILKNCVHYRWYRGKSRAICTFHPHRLATVQCAVTLRCFCDSQCFIRGHRQLHRFYVSRGSEPIPKHVNPNCYGVPCTPFRWDDFDANRNVDTLHYCLLQESGLSMEPSFEEWELVSIEQNYTPSNDDVGHQLRLECFLEAPSTGHSPSSESRRRQSSSLPGCKFINGPPLSKSLSIVKHHSAEDITPLRSSSFSSQISFRNEERPDGDPASLRSVSDRSNRSMSPDNKKAQRNGSSHNTVIKHPYVDENVATISWPSEDDPLRNDSSKFVSITTGCVVQQLPFVKLPSFVPLTNSSIENYLTKRKSSASWNQLSEMSHSTLVRPNPTNSFQFMNFRDELSKVSERGSTDPKESHSTKSFPKIPFVQSNNKELKPFTVMSWNVLAEIYATQEQFPYCESYTLAWPYRKRRILQTIVEANADIVCLQEVQSEYFSGFFLPALREHGYDGVYKRKTNEIFSGVGGHSVGGKFTMDGCATFYKVGRFRIVDNCALEFSSVIQEAVRQTFLSLNSPEGKVPAPFVRRLLRDNIALLLLLEDLENDPLAFDSQDVDKFIGSLGTSGFENLGNSGFPSGNHLVTPSALETSVCCDSSGLHRVETHNSLSGSSVHHPGYNHTTVNSPDNAASNPSVVSSMSAVEQLAADLSSMRRQIVIANTHIVANPEANDAKIWQTQMLVSVMERYLRQQLEFLRVQYTDLIIRCKLQGLKNSEATNAAISPKRGDNTSERRLSLYKSSREYQPSIIAEPFNSCHNRYSDLHLSYQSCADENSMMSTFIPNVADKKSFSDMTQTITVTKPFNGSDIFPQSNSVSTDQYTYNHTINSRTGTAATSTAENPLTVQQQLFCQPGYPLAHNNESFYTNIGGHVDVNLRRTTAVESLVNSPDVASALSPYAPVFQSFATASNITKRHNHVYAIEAAQVTKEPVLCSKPVFELPLHWKPGLVLTGDFNSTPASAVYQLLSQGACDRRHQDLLTDRLDLLSRVHLGHSLPLKSSYTEARSIHCAICPELSRNVEGTISFSGEPPFTNYTSNYVGCLDYIFFGDDTLTVSGYRPTFSETELKKEAESQQFPSSFLPTPVRPSDHLPLFVEFNWKHLSQ